MNWMVSMKSMWKPFAGKPPVHIMRCGVLAQVLGILVMSVMLFTKIPLITVICLPAGAALILLGCLIWAWAVYWAPQD